MSVVVACEEAGPWCKKLTIEIPAQAVEAEVGRVIGDYRRKLKIPGFRRGKIPVSLVRSRYWDAIEQEVAQRLVPRYWHQAQAEQNLDPLLPPRFEDPRIEDGEPMTLVASVETRPEIEIGELGEFSLPSESTEPLDEEVDEALADLARQHAAWSPVDRSAGRGDLVLARLETLEGEAPKADASGKAPKIHVEIGGEGVPEELSLALTDLSAGQHTEYRGVLTGEAEGLYRLEVEEVKEQDVPEIDDAFAARMGPLESADALREAMVDELRRSKQGDLRRRREQALLEQLRERHPMELPAGVVQHESEELVERYAQRLAQQGVDIEKVTIDWEKLLAEAGPEAERRVHDRLLLDAVAKAEGVRLDEPEFERLLATLAAQQETSTPALRAQLSENGRLEPLRAQLLREQTVRRLLGEDSPDTENPKADAASPSEES